MAAKRPTTRKVATPRAAPARRKSAASAKEPLVLNRKELRQSMAALFQKVDTDERARQRFIQDPSGLIMERVFQEKLPAQRASESNRLLFSVLANERFMQWMDEYSVQNRGRRVSKAQFNQDFAKALVEFGDHELMVSMLSNVSAGFGIPGIDERANQLLINNAAGTAVITPVNTPSTSDQTAHSSSNANGVGFGDLGRLVDPAVLRSVTEQLLAHARELKASGALADLSTRIR